jgi:GAF domain-containing protein
MFICISIHPMEQQALDTLQDILRTQGLVAALQFLNDRVPHRFTGIYRVDGQVLHNVAVIDKQQSGDIGFLMQVPLSDSFCQFVLRDGQLVTTDSGKDPRVDASPFKGVMGSYVGLPLAVVPGELFGTFCHFDFEPQPLDDSEFEFLTQAARVLPPFVKPA